MPAGVQRMSLPVFVGYTALGSLVWNTVFVLAGYQLGENWHRVEAYSDLFQKAVIAAVALGIIAAVGAGVMRSRHRGAHDGRR